MRIKINVKISSDKIQRRMKWNECINSETGMYTDSRHKYNYTYRQYHIQLNGTLIYSWLQPLRCAHKTMKQPTVWWNYWSVFWLLIATWLSVAAIKFLEFLGRLWCSFVISIGQRLPTNNESKRDGHCELMFQKSARISFRTLAFFSLVIWKIFQRKIYSKENGLVEISDKLLEDWDQYPDTWESIEMEKRSHREKSSEFGKVRWPSHRLKHVQKKKYLSPLICIVNQWN